MTSTRDMLKDLSDELITEIAKDMNEVQRECFTVYCRNLEKELVSFTGLVVQGRL